MPTWPGGRCRRQRANAALADLGIDTRHYAVLAAVDGDDGPSQRMIADALGIDRATVVALTDSLEERKFLRRARSGTDRRAYALHLTASGVRLLHRAHDLMDQCGRDLLAVLPAPTQQDMGAALRRVLAGLPPAAG